MSGPPILFPAVDVMKQMFAAGEDAVWFCSNVDLVLLQFIVVVVYNGLNLIVSFWREHWQSPATGIMREQFFRVCQLFATLYQNNKLLRLYLILKLYS